MKNLCTALYQKHVRDYYAQTHIRVVSGIARSEIRLLSAEVNVLFKMNTEIPKEDMTKRHGMWVITSLIQTESSFKFSFLNRANVFDLMISTQRALIVFGPSQLKLSADKYADEYADSLIVKLAFKNEHIEGRFTLPSQSYADIIAQREIVFGAPVVSPWTDVNLRLAAENELLKVYFYHEWNQIYIEISLPLDDVRAALQNAK